MNVLDDISEAVIKGDAEATSALAKQIVADKKIDLNDAIIHGLNKGMKVVGELYDKREYFLPEIIVAADALYEALEIFKPHLKTTQKYKATVICGVVRGDIHDIGKNVVKLFLEASGYKVIDLGRNVPAEKFVDAVKEYQAEVLALSTLMSPTLESMSEVVDLLKSQGLHEKVNVIIGGAATDEKFAEEIGATYLEDANSAIKFLNAHFSGGK
ncbi:MAG: corrinoid protein [Candidatus Helarchaeota archaeon]|nr:corrinoid protein [Candidatus Helarchaeota archaeon]